MNDSPALTPTPDKAFPTVAELSALGADLARSGFAPHEQRLTSLVELARRSGRAPASVDVVVDPTAPVAVRARAFSALTAAWTGILDGLRALPEYRDFDTAFADLLSAWNDRQRLRSGDAPLAERLEARRALDRHRLITALRRGHLVRTLATAVETDTACA